MCRKQWEPVRQLCDEFGGDMKKRVSKKRFKSDLDQELVPR